MLSRFSKIKLPIKPIFKQYTRNFSSLQSIVYFISLLLAETENVTIPEKILLTDECVKV